MKTDLEEFEALLIKFNMLIKALEEIHDRPEASLSIQAICERVLEEVRQ
jgi:hypothetical protein